MTEPWFTVLPFFHLFNFETKKIWYSVRFEKDSRYYVMRLEQDLFEYWTINAINGRIKSRLGQSRILAFDSFDKAFGTFCEMIKTRYQHEYTLKSLFTQANFLLEIIPFMRNIYSSSENAFKIKKERITTTKDPVKTQRKILVGTIPEQMSFVF